MRVQSANKRQAKSYNRRKRQVDEDLHARNRAQADMDRDMQEYEEGMEEESPERRDHEYRQEQYDGQEPPYNPLRQKNY